MLHQLRARVEKRRRSVAHVEFRSRGGSRDKSDLLWVGTHGATILAGHLLDSVVRNSEIRRGAFGLAIPAKIPAKWTAAVGLCLDFQSLATVFRGNSESN
jgi:hypothetical protein